LLRSISLLWTTLDLYKHLNTHACFVADSSQCSVCLLSNKQYVSISLLDCLFLPVYSRDTAFSF
jgi:hypothetical protein